MGGFIFIILMLTIRTVVASPNNQIYLIMPHSGSAGHKHSNLNCLSWRLAVETNNRKNWKQVPEACECYVGHYMLGKQYRQDCNFVANEAYKYAKRLNLTRDSKDVWVFDIDETTLSNIPYYARDTVAFGAKPYDAAAFNEWVEEAAAPAIPAALKLYKQLIKMGFKIVFITATEEAYKEARIKNLKKAGYTTWEELIFKKDTDGSGVVYKSSKRKALEKAGYRIRGNMGDQWSDLLGTNPGDRIFKLPDPMYYIG